MDIKIIGVDFDGTIAFDRYPNIGNPIPDAFEVLKELQDNGHKLILWTIRMGEELEEAVDFCKENGIEFWGVNENPTQKEWNDSPKAFTHYYVDDRNVGCPLLYDVDGNRYVDWTKIRRELIMRRIL